MFNLITQVMFGKEEENRKQKKRKSGNDLYETEMVRLITQMDVQN